MENVATTTQSEGPAWSVAWTTEEGTERARGLFQEAFGYAATVVRGAPGRITIVGEHTDYSAGVSLTTVTKQAAYVAGAARTDNAVRVVWREADGTVQRWEGTLADAYPGGPGSGPAATGLAPMAAGAPRTLGVLWALSERGYVGGGLDLALDTCVPLHAGLAPGIADAAALALTIEECWGLALGSDVGRAEIAEMCIDAQQHFSGVPTAGVGQHTVLRCPPGQALLLDFLEPKPKVTEQPLYFPEYGLALLLIDTGAPNTLTLEEYSRRWHQIEQACDALGVGNLREVADAPHALRRVESIPDPVVRARARHVVTEISRVRLVTAELSGTAPAHERFVSVGKALYRSHASLDVDYEVSNTQLNTVVDGAFGAGALGARVVEGGFGGAAFALVRRAAVESTARHINQTMLDAGYPAPTFSLI